MNFEFFCKFAEKILSVVSAFVKAEASAHVDLWFFAHLSFDLNFFEYGRSIYAGIVFYDLAQFDPVIIFVNEINAFKAEFRDEVSA